jgi:hypothetical protein
MSDDLPPQFQEPKRPEPQQQLYEELPVDPPPPDDVPEEPPRPSEPFLRQG